MYGCIEDCKRGEPFLSSFSFSSSFASYYVAAVVVVTVVHDNAGEKGCSRILGLVAVESECYDAFWVRLRIVSDEGCPGGHRDRVSHPLEGLSKKVIRSTASVATLLQASGLIISPHYGTYP